MYIKNPPKRRLLEYFTPNPFLDKIIIVANISSLKTTLYLYFLVVLPSSVVPRTQPPLLFQQFSAFIVEEKYIGCKQSGVGGTK